MSTLFVQTTCFQLGSDIYQQDEELAMSLLLYPDFVPDPHTFPTEESNPNLH